MSIYFDLLKKLASMDRCHSGPEMEKAYTYLCEHYPDSKLLSFPRNERVNHWEAPPFWTCRKAELIDEEGNLIASRDTNLLTVFSYSPPVNKWVSFKELDRHLFSDPQRPEAVCFHFRNQYRFWDPEWGFCIPHRERLNLNAKRRYKVVIESEFNFSRPMTQAEYHREGATNETFLLIGHFDHPGQVNDGLAGCIVAFETIRRLPKNTYFSYTAFASVEIVGSMFYLAALNRAKRELREGLFLAFSGIDSPLSYQTSAQGQSTLDRIINNLFTFSYEAVEDNLYSHQELVGNDENVFDSVGYEIPTGTLMRWPFPQYHTDADNLTITDENRLEEMIELNLRIVDALEKNFYLKAHEPGIPCLARPEINLYLSPDSVSGIEGSATTTLPGTTQGLTGIEEAYLREHSHQFNRLMRVLTRLADGKHNILDVADSAEMPFTAVYLYALQLKNSGVMAFGRQAF